MSESAARPDTRSVRMHRGSNSAHCRHFDRVCGVVAMSVENGFQSIKCKWGILFVLAFSMFDKERRDELYELEIIHTRADRRRVKAEKREHAALVSKGLAFEFPPIVTNQWKAAEYLDVRPWVLMKMRRDGGGPRYMRFDKWLSPRYSFRELDAWRTRNDADSRAGD